MYEDMFDLDILNRTEAIKVSLFFKMLAFKVYNVDGLRVKG